MNIELIKINKNVGIVTDEAGKSKTVEVHDANLESVLLKENELENAKKTLEGIQDDFDFLNINNHKAKMECLTILIVGCIYALMPIFSVLEGNITWVIASKLLAPVAIFFGGYAAFYIILQKYIFNRNTQKIMKEKEILEKKVHDLEEELDVLKERSQFKEFSKSEEKADARTDDMILGNDYANNVSYSYNPRDVKVLKLVPERNRNKNKDNK